MIIKNDEKKYGHEKLFYGLLTLLLLIYSIFMISSFSFFSSIALVFAPMIFLIGLILLNYVRKSIFKFDLITLYIVFYMFIRYILYPIFYSFMDSDNSSSDYISSVIIFYLEEILFLVFLNLFLKIFNKNEVSNKTIEMKKGNYWLIVIIAFLSIYFILRYESIKVNYIFIFNMNPNSILSSDFSSPIESIGYIIVDITRLVIPLFFINFFYERYCNNSNYVFLVLSFISCFIPMLIIKNMNRGSSFFTSIIYLYLVNKIYGWKKCKNLLIISISSLVLLLFVVSNVKHSTSLSQSGYSMNYLYDVIKSYTIGIDSIEFGIKTNTTYQNYNGLSVFLNDLLYSTPILNRFSNQAMKYSSLYNSMYYFGVYNKNDAISPLITNMLFCFGPIGFFVPFLFLYFSIKIYCKSKMCKTINVTFICIYISIVLESGRTGSFSATISTMLWSIVPLVLFLIVLDKVSFIRS